MSTLNKRLVHNLHLAFFSNLLIRHKGIKEHEILPHKATTLSQLGATLPNHFVINVISSRHNDTLEFLRVLILHLEVIPNTLQVYLPSLRFEEALTRTDVAIITILPLDLALSST
ncbi:UNVERIFIED_CONTAM: hypothetical protein Sangu_1326700 [Sesamum angustifolium]|uniref:Maturase K n=1 Tax=Sesamum angustifolium TaxID=2727405 RepID=A0AAW2NND0_9LAMI